MCKVSIPSERKMRKRAKELIREDILVVENVPLTFPLKERGEEVRLRPYGYITDIWAQVKQLLEDNERYKQRKLSNSLQMYLIVLGMGV